MPPNMDEDNNVIQLNAWIMHFSMILIYNNLAQRRYLFDEKEDDLCWVLDYLRDAILFG